MHTRRRWPIRRILLCLVGVYLAWQLSFLVIGTRLQIGRDTTYVTGPLKSDGSIDYAAAIHELMSKGVMPEDNAAVLIIRAFGPSAISPEQRSQYFEWLGIEALPERGDYFVPQSTLIAMKLQGADGSPDLNEQLSKDFAQALQHAWNQTDYPLVAEWLKVNAVPLELIEQASRRSRYYSPPVREDGQLQSLTMVQNVRQVARLLVTRAMFRLGANDVEGAWSDLLACHRFAGLAGQRAQSMTDYQVAVALNSTAAQGDAALINHGLTLAQAQKCLADCNDLDPFGDVADLIEEGGRLESLDAVLNQIPVIGLDINTMLKSTNRLFDDLVAAMRLKTPAKRKKAVDAIDKEFQIRIAASRKLLPQIANYIVATRRTVTRSVGDVLLSNLLPPYLHTDAAQIRTQIRRDQVRIGFALAAYHAENGTYPQALDELLPKYLSDVPLDPYTEKPFVYVFREKGFLVYSIGVNGKDDGGIMRGPNSEDDIPFEVPPKIDE